VYERQLERRDGEAKGRHATTFPTNAAPHLAHGVVGMLLDYRLGERGAAGAAPKARRMTFAAHAWRRLGAAALIALGALLSSQSTMAQNLETIRFGTGPDDQAVPLLYAAKSGIYKKYGLNVDVQRLPGASAVAAALAGGSLEMGKGSSMGVVTAIAKGLPFTVIGNLAYYEADKPDIALLVLKDGPIKTAKDLEGKTLAAVSLQDMNSVATFAWLDQHGVDRSTLKYVEIPASAALAAMEQNRVVASTIYEPYFSQFLAGGKVRVLGYPFEAISKKFSDALIFAPTKWAGEHRDAIDRFLRATQEASLYIASHESESTKLIAEFGGLDPATLGSVRHAGRGVPLSPSDVQPVIDVAAKYNVIPKAFPATDIICSCAMKK
jgi:NitT/TauT family transport system substrate-binding protein